MPECMLSTMHETAREDGEEPAASVLRAAGHRPGALPRRPWRVTQRWHDLLFAHWPLPPSELAPLLPTGVVADLFDQSAWIGVVPFWMDRVALRGLPSIPGTNRFPELNLRACVRERNTNCAGLFFFSLEAANPLAVAMARMALRLPYHWARMTVQSHAGREFSYSSDRLFSQKPVAFRARYRALGQSRLAERSRPGTLEHFLTERYSFYVRGPRGELQRGDIHHMPWPLETAEAEIECNTLPAAYGIRLPDTPPVLHYAQELAVYLWSPETVPLAHWKAIEAAGARPAELL